jgi:uncharacterized membrane protein YjfL (UPF0719 family)
MELKPLYAFGFTVGTTLALLVMFRVVQAVTTPQVTVAKNFKDGNTARHLLDVGQVLSVFMIAAATVKNTVQGEDVMTDVVWSATFGMLGLALVALMGRVSTNLLLKSSLPAEIARGNTAAGVAAGSQYVAVGIVAAHAIAGSKLRDIGLSMLFFFIAIVVLFIFILLFRALTTYDDAEQIQGENLAASLSYAGLSIAVAIIVGCALDGDFVNWTVSLKGFGAVLAFALALYPVRQLFVQTLLLGAPLALRGGRLDTGIGTDRNAGMGALEAVTYVATALSVARLV